MSFTESEIFGKKGIISARVLVSEYIFSLDEILTPIRIKIYREVNSHRPADSYLFETSHSIHTPEQIGPYTPSAPWTDTPEYALKRAVDSIISYYQQAIQKGHTPNENWLVPNDVF